MNDFPAFAQSVQNDKPDQSDLPTGTNTLTGAQRIKTQYSHLVPLMNSSKPCNELTEDLSIAAGDKLEGTLTAES